MIKQSEDLFSTCMTKSPTYAYDSKVAESKHQADIAFHLEAAGFIVIKIVAANKGGNSDIVACSLSGQFWTIEVKKETGRPSAIQTLKLKKVWKRGGIAMIAYGYADFVVKFSLLNDLDERQTTT